MRCIRYKWRREKSFQCYHKPIQHAYGTVPRTGSGAYCPRHTWLRTVEADLRPFNLGLASGFKKAQDRTIPGAHSREWLRHRQTPNDDDDDDKPITRVHLPVSSGTSCQQQRKPDGRMCWDDKREISRSCWRAANRWCCRLTTSDSETGTGRQLRRYCSALCWRHWWTVTASEHIQNPLRDVQSLQISMQ